MIKIYIYLINRRYRTTYHDNTSDIKITIDEFPFDNFIEIEGVEEDIKAVAQKLRFGLLSQPHKALGYII